ncbi:DEAD/DEAH box helicase family protein, partial [bacterium]|nr:DEAD/DEAH box helicase family protein [bacterium]
MTVNDQFPTINFSGTLRPSQADVAKIAKAKLSTGNRKLHIVAPPGSGKTVLGLYLWAEFIRTPALVLSPNSAIQAQWAARTDLFEMPPDPGTVSTDSKAPGLLTSLTYQAVTLPKRGDAELEDRAIDLWVERLIEKEQARDPDEALVWIEDLDRHNPDYYNRRLGSYRKKVRDNDALEGNAMATLHESSRQTLQRLKDRGIGLVILDECHHLMGHWGRVLAGAHEFLGEPVVIGLTATPPDRTGKHAIDIERYDKYFGPFDYEIPVPAVVRDGFLAPYQDLSWFVRPTSEELKFIASADQQFEAIVEELCAARPDSPQGGPPSAVVDHPTTTDSSQTIDSAANAVQSGANSTTDETILPTVAAQQNATVFNDNAQPADVPVPAETSPTAARVAPMQSWLYDTLENLRLPTGSVGDWSKFELRDPDFSQMARIYLLQSTGVLPPNVPEPVSELSFDEIPPMRIITPVIDRYVRHGLRRSANSLDHNLEREVVQRLRILGIQITETGCQPCASPVGRVMAYSTAKCDAL